MSLETAQRAGPSTGHFSTQRETAPYRWHVYAACTVVAIALNYLLGKEMASDLLHYHFYAGFSALNDRFEHDYFAAGPNSYLNPYAYAPFYVLLKTSLPGLAVGTILAAIHSVVLWLTYELACRVSPFDDRRQRFFFGLYVTVFAFMNPVLLQQIGSSFSDITTTGLVLSGWLLLVQALLHPRTRLVVFAAAALGIAAALKPTNGLYAIAALFLVAFLPLSIAGRIRNLLYFAATLAAGFALIVAPWSWRLEQMFGNPMFPLLNNLFKSPEITTSSAKAYRFIPDSLADGLLRPFAMTGADNMIAEELAAPDVRYAMLLVVSLLCVVAWVRRSTARSPNPPVTAASKSSTRVLTALGCGFTFSWIVWLVNSGNSRYFLPMECVATVIAVTLLFRLMVNHTLGRNAILAALLIAQGIALSETQFRWNQAPWGGRWFEVEMPEKLASQPSLFLSIGMQSNSYIAPFLPKGSGVINFAGGYALGPGGANAARVRAMINLNKLHLRVLVAGDRIYEDSAQRLPRQSDVNDALREFALRVDMSDCETVTIRGMRPTVWRPLESSLVAPPIPPSGTLRFTTFLASCRVVADTEDLSKEIAARRAADVVLNRLEDACPALFKPSRPQTEHINQAWLRFYGATDLTAWIGRGDVNFASAVRDTATVSVGREDAWAKQPLPLECGRLNGVYFARLAKAGL